MKTLLAFSAEQNAIQRATYFQELARLINAPMIQRALPNSNYLTVACRTPSLAPAAPSPNVISVIIQFKLKPLLALLPVQNSIFGTTSTESTVKKGYKLPRPMMTNADLTRIINSDEIQSAIRPVKEGGARHRCVELTKFNAITTCCEWCAAEKPRCAVAESSPPEASHPQAPKFNFEILDSHT